MSLGIKKLWHFFHCLSIIFLNMIHFVQYDCLIIDDDLSLFIYCVLFLLFVNFTFLLVFTINFCKNTNNLSLMTEYPSTHPRRCITVTSNKFSAVCFILIIAVVFIWKTPLILVSRGCVLPIVSFPLPMSLLIKTKL